MIQHLALLGRKEKKKFDNTENRKRSNSNLLNVIKDLTKYKADHL